MKWTRWANGSNRFSRQAAAPPTSDRPGAHGSRWRETKSCRWSNITRRSSAAPSSARSSSPPKSDGETRAQRFVELYRGKLSVAEAERDEVRNKLLDAEKKVAEFRQELEAAERVLATGQTA
jgi:hypothetical protein